jgi:endogenous inhibitor of DNA gyrase (YacG/DUF329 family)
MADRNPRAFAHRSNGNGTWDSICLRCYRTVATAPNASRLPMTETRHTCALIDLHVWVADRYEYGSMACQNLPIADFVSKTCRLIRTRSLRPK